jgi:hypothetical protein
MGKACAARWRSSTVKDGSRRRNCAVVVHSSQLAQQQAQSYAAAQAKETKAVADHVRHVQARWFACLPDAEAAIAEYAGRGQGHRGRRPRPWRYHALSYSIVAETHRTRRARRGRPAKTDPPPTESGYRLVVEVEVLSHPEEDNGWTVLATTVGPERLFEKSSIGGTSSVNWRDECEIIPDRPH